MTRDFYHPTRNATQLKTYELFISGTFHVIFLDPSSLRAKLQKSKTTDKRGATVPLSTDEETEAEAN